MSLYARTMYSIVGTPVDVEDIILYTLNRLPASFQSFKSTIRTWVEPITLADLYSLLYNEETNLQAKVAKEISISSLALQSHKGRGTSSQYRGHGRNFYSPRCGHFSSLGNGDHGRSLATDQICEKDGHFAAACWHRANFDYVPNKMTSSPSTMIVDSSSQQQTPISTEWLLDTSATSNLTNDYEQLQHP